VSDLDFSDSWTITDCLKRIEHLEDFKIEKFNNKLQEEQAILEKQIEIVNSELISLQTAKRKIDSKNNIGNDYQSFIKKYNDQSLLYNFEKEYSCPLCGTINKELIIEATDIIQAQNWLKQELINVPVQAQKFEKELNDIIVKINEKKKLSSELGKRFKNNEKLIENIGKKEDLNKKRRQAKWKVESAVEIYKERKVEFDEKYLDEAKVTLDKCLERKTTYKESDRYLIEKSNFEDILKRIVEKLDFEHKPPELYFELNPHKSETAYKLYHNTLNDRRIFLRQIGSASNALACHVGLFLSFLNYFSNQKASKVPSILFFDQPSQVYFPSGTDNTDIEKVAQIYETILDELKKIKESAGYLPQIIVADHIKDLGKENVNLFDDYFKANWREPGEGLI
jgi:hypothetical protein